METDLDFAMSKIKNLLERATYNIENHEIYDHGYTEARLIPTDFFETCEREHLNHFKDEISEIVEDYLMDLYEYI